MIAGRRGPGMGSRWVDVERRWPLWSAMRERAAAVDVLDRAVRNLASGGDLLDEMLSGDAIAPRVARSMLSVRHEQGTLTRDLVELAARPGVRRQAGVLTCAATAMDDVVGMMEHVADLYVMHGIPRAIEPSRRLSDLLLDMSRLIADGWTRALAGASIDLQLRGLSRAHRQAIRLGREANAALLHGEVADGSVLASREIVARQLHGEVADGSVLASREIVARQLRAVGHMNGGALIVLLVPRGLGTRPGGLASFGATVSGVRALLCAWWSMPSPRFRAKDDELLALFARAGENLRRTGELLDRLLTDWPDTSELREEILECEHVGDRITHDLIHHLRTARPRTFEREDVFGLAAALDDVVDFAEEVADYLGLYQIEAPMEGAQQLAAVLRQACSSLADALARLHDAAGVRPLLVEIHRLENEGDRIVRAAIASLFVGGIDPMVIIRWKDLFERLEDAIDSCETAAHIIEGIAVRSG